MQPRLLLLFLVFFQCQIGFSQSDSLLNLANTATGDSLKAYYFNLTAQSYYRSSPAKTIEYAQKAYEISNGKKIKSLVALSAYNLGVGNFFQANYPTALEHLLESSKIFEELGEQMSIARGMNLAGGIYQTQGQYDLAAESFLKALKIFRELDLKAQQAKMLINIGEIRQKQHKPDEAFEYIQEALEIAQAEGMTADVGFVNGIMGQILEEKGEFKEALDYTLTALPNFRQANLKTAEAEYGLIAARLHRKLGELDKAVVQARQAISIAQQANARNWLKDAYQELAEIYKAKGEYRQSLEAFEQFSLLKDTIYSAENSSKFADLQTKYESEKKQTQILLQEAEIEQFQQSRWYGAGFIAFLLLAIGGILAFVFNINKKRERLQLQNAEIQEQQEEILTQRNDIEVKNQEIEQKNEKIMSSLRYAKRIQQTLMPSAEKILGGFADGFILLMPKDVVSGDFYFYEEVRCPKGNLKKIIAAVDCTGHGVPGALMSMVGLEQLTEIINIEKVCTANGILEHLHKGVVKVLKQETSDSRDGMDMAVCIIDEQAKSMEFAGAKNGIIYFQQEKMTFIKGDRDGIGGKANNRDEDIQFTSHTISIEQPTTFYLFSDGFQDQFGGDEKRKFSPKRLRHLLSEMNLLPMPTQQEILEKTLEDWMLAGREDQIDDVLVMGFRIDLG